MKNILSFFKKLIKLYGVFIPLLCAVIFTIVDINTGNAQDWNKYLLSNLLVIGLGYQMVFLGFGHLFYGDKIAEFIGWEKGSPFQYEVGIAGLAMGVLGILCNWYTGLFWLATIIVSSIYLWGCVLGHIRDMVKNKNFNPGSAGFIFYYGMLMPLALIVLYALY